MSSSQVEKNKSVIRLASMAKYTDGFKLSEIDLKLRGPGEIFGIKQSGLPEFKYANIIDDIGLLDKAKSDAFNIISSDPALASDKNKIVRKNISEKYSDNILLSQIA